MLFLQQTNMPLEQLDGVVQSLHCLPGHLRPRSVLLVLAIVAQAQLSRLTQVPDEG